MKILAILSVLLLILGACGSFSSSREEISEEHIKQYILDTSQIDNAIVSFFNNRALIAIQLPKQASELEIIEIKKDIKENIEEKYALKATISLISTKGDGKTDEIESQLENNTGKDVLDIATP